MMKIKNKPLLDYVYNQVSYSKKISKIVIATTTLSEDDAIIDYAALNDGEPPETLEQLTEDGYLTSLPDPPSGTMWVLNPDGTLTYQRL